MVQFGIINGTHCIVPVYILDEKAVQRMAVSIQRLHFDRYEGTYHNSYYHIASRAGLYRAFLRERRFARGVVSHSRNALMVNAVI